MINLLYIAFEIKLWPFSANNGSALRNSLFADVKLTANPDPDKDSYSGYGI